LNNQKKYDFIKKIKENKKIQIAIILTLLVFMILLLCFGGVFQKTSDEQTDVALNYVAQLENRLQNTIKKINGVGDVNVIINVESGMETVIAMEKTINKTADGIETVEKPVLVNGKTVVLKEAYPKIVGVIIVAEGASNITLMTKIQQATTALLDINANKIEILSM